MSGYLVVAHQTAGSRELADCLTKVVHRDHEARFTLLIPATDPSHLLVWEDGDAESIARRKAEEARASLHGCGVEVAETKVGAASPIAAIEAELRDNPGRHDSVILCTLPPGISHWIGLDIPTDAEEKFGVPVEHVTAGGAYR